MTTATTQPSPFLTWIAPNWFAAVMGTGIVATSATVVSAGLRPFATGAWLLAAVLLLVVSTLTALQWWRYRPLARSHHRHPVLAHFYGAPPMALLTVGAGTLLLGPDLIGATAALRIDHASAANHQTLHSRYVPGPVERHSDLHRPCHNALTGATPSARCAGR